MVNLFGRKAAGLDGRGQGKVEECLVERDQKTKTGKGEDMN